MSPVLSYILRPNIEFGTIEFRICDAGNSVQEIMAIVAFIQNLVEMVDRDPSKWKWDQRQHWVSPENHWIAARDGLNGVITTGSSGEKKQIREEIYSLIDELTPIAHSLNNYDELIYLKAILKHGNGALRQREVFNLDSAVEDAKSTQSLEP